MVQLPSVFADGLSDTNIGGRHCDTVMPSTTRARRVNTRIEAHTYRTRIVTPRIERTPPRQAYKLIGIAVTCDCSRPTNLASRSRRRRCWVSRRTAAGSGVEVTLPGVHEPG